eukprot:403543_1
MWASLKPPPPNCNSNFVTLNPDEFVVAAKTTNTHGYVSGIYKYSVTTNDWTLLFKYPPKLVNTFQSNICLNHLKNRLYLLYLNKSIQFDLSTIHKKDDLPHSCIQIHAVLTNHTQKGCDIECYSCIQIHAVSNVCATGLVINNRLHTISADGSVCHRATDEHLRQRSLIETIIADSGLYNHGCVYVSTQLMHCILLFGGYSANAPSDQIWKYSLDGTDSHWERLTLKLPHAMHAFGYTLSMNRYIFIFGGHGGSALSCDAIYIWDLQTMTIQLSEQRCPTKGWFYAVSMCCDYSTVIQAYTRKLNINAPKDIVRMIACLVGNEYIHLFALHKRDLKFTKHWKIPAQFLI